MLTLDDESHLAFYFRAASLFQRSTFGAQLERARVTIGGRPRSWAWLPSSTGDGAPVHVPATHEPSMGYEVDHGDLLRFSRVSRRMQATARADGAFDVLEAYYGDRGCRWQATAAGRPSTSSTPAGSGPSVVATGGKGPGAIAALYSLTPAGRALLDRERRATLARRCGTVPGGGDVEAERALRRAVAEAGRAHGAAVAALQEAMTRHHEARQAGPVPTPLRVALHAARGAEAERRGRLDEAKRRLDLLTRPFHAPRREEQRPAGVEGPTLPDGRWSPADPPPALRLAARPLPTGGAGAAGDDHLTDDELLEVVFILEGVSSRPDRKRRLQEARDQAEVLLVRAWEAWLGSGPPRTPRRSLPEAAAGARPVEERRGGGGRGRVQRVLDPRFARGASVPAWVGEAGR